MNYMRIIGIIVTALVVIVILKMILNLYKNLLVLDKLPEKIKDMDNFMSKRLSELENGMDTRMERVNALEQDLLHQHAALCERREQFVQCSQDALKSVDNIFETLELLSAILNDTAQSEKKQKIEIAQEKLRFNIRVADRHLEELRQLDLQQRDDNGQEQE